MKIALLQLLPGASLEENLDKGLAACKRAKKRGADIALFPEMWSNGYWVYADPRKLAADAVDADGDFVSAFGRQAKALDMAIAITFLERYSPSPRNTVTLFDRHGKNILTYAKVHTCDFDVERNLTPGEDFYTAILDTAQGPVEVGAMVCYDREFPESARILMLKGAELILVPNACPMEVNRLEQLRARAFENMTAIATCNYPAGQPDCNGHSTVFDGVAWLPHWAGARDMRILKAAKREGIYIADIDLKLLREYRACEAMGNAYRHPSKYGILTETAVKAPFVRADRRE